MLGRLVAAQFELEAAVARLRTGTDSVGIARGELSLNDLLALQRSVATASPSALAGMRAEILAAAATIANEAKQAASSSATDAPDALTTASARARDTVRAVMDGMKDFDPYLRFASDEDREAYRKREEANRRAIDAAMAEGTPEGTARALKLAEAQLRDAGAHGADTSPAYASRLEDIKRREAELQTAGVVSPAAGPKADGQASPEKPDDLGDVLAVLKAAGVSSPAAAESSGHGLAENQTSKGGEVRRG